jgi:hypothetical protein
LIAPNGFQLYAVVVLVVMMFNTVLKLIKYMLLNSIPTATIAYKLLLAADLSSPHNPNPIKLNHFLKLRIPDKERFLTKKFFD